MPARKRPPHTNIQLTDDEIAALRAEARERKVSMSRVIEEAVCDFLADEASLVAGLIRPSLKERRTRQRGFVLSADARGLLREAKRTHRFAQNDVVREAISPIVRHRIGG